MSSHLKDEKKGDRKDRARPHNITILNDDNFNIWKWELKYNLKTLGLYDVIVDPSKFDQKLDDQAMYEVIGTLSDKVKNKVSHCKTAADLYRAIESIYSNKTSFQVTSLNMKLANFKFKSVDKISDGLSEIQSIVNKIKNCGEQISDKMVEGVILAALPEHFRTFITVWKGINESERTLTNLISRIMAEVDDCKTFNQKDNSALAAAKARGFGFKNNKSAPPRNKKFQPNNKPQSTSRKPGQSKIICNYCKKPGHIVKDCRKLKYKNDGENKIRDKSEDNDKREHKSPAALAAVTAMFISENENDLWIADSGASCHMSFRKDWFMEFEKLDHPQNVKLAKGMIRGYGRGKIETNRGILQNVLYVPELETNLYSIRAATELGMRVEYDDDSVVFIRKDDNEILLDGHLRGPLYFLNMDVVNQENYHEAHIAHSLSDWHKRFAHISPNVIKNMAKSNIVDGLNIQGDKENLECVDCSLNKGKSASHPSKTTEKTKIAGASLHVDTVGPIRETSLGGSEYFILCKDEASGYRNVSFVKTKSSISSEVKKIISKSELETTNKVLRLVSDNGTEFVNQDLNKYLDEKGIEHSVSAPYTPQQNGYIERDIQTITQAARTMLNQSNLPRKLWAEAVNTAVYVLNRVPSTKNPDTTPYELWFKKKPNVENLRVFGQYAVVNNQKHNRDGKWDTTGDTMRLVGYTNSVNTYKFYSEIEDVIIISCNATFLKKTQITEIIDVTDSNDENNILVTSRPVLGDDNSEKENSILQEDNDNPVAGSSGTFFYDEEGFYDEVQNEVMDISDPSNTYIISTPLQDNDRAIEAPHPRESTPVREITVPRNLQMRWGPMGVQPSRLRPRDKRVNYNTEQAKAASSIIDDEPTNFKQILKRADSNKWLEAMNEELESLDKNQVWDLVDRPKGINIVTNRWVLRIKRKTTGEIDRYRARLVARGFTQVHGIDYNETFAPVVNVVTVRLLFAYAAKENLYMKGFDVKAAFLYGYLDEVVYMEQPEGFEDGTDKVCLLKKSLYGLKQAPRQWNKEFSNFLSSLNLQVSEHDRCIYYRLKPARLIIAIYVDDGIIFAERKSDIDSVMTQLKKRFDIHEVDLSSFLGFQIERDDSCICLHQENYIRKILQKFNMTNCNTIDNPSTITKNSKSETESVPLDENVPYREAIGSLLYAATVTRIDIAYSVNKASRDVASPTTYSWLSAKRIMRYLKDKEEGYLCYGPDSEDGLYAYCDADLAGDSTYKSTTGYVIMYGGGPIQWKSQRQPIVSLSSTEAELVGMCSLVKEMVWIRKLSQELGIIDNAPSTVYCDNQSAIRLAINEKSVQRTRHMGIRAAFTREQIENKEIEVEHVKSEEQLADFLTKPLTSSRFMYNRSKLMYFLSILAIIMCLKGESTRLDECKPIIWQPTHHRVEAGTTEYVIDFTVMDPCISLERKFIRKKRDSANNTIPNYDVFNVKNPEDEQIARRTIEECKNMYNHVYLTRLQDLIIKGTTRADRHKRSILESVVKASENIIGVSIISNLISSTIDYFNPDSTRNKVIKDEEKLAMAIQNFEIKFNITHEVQQGILNSLEQLSRDVQDQKRKLNHIVDLLPRITWVSSFLQSRITSAATDIKYITEEFMYGRVSVREMEEMLSLPALEGVRNEDTKFLSISKPHPSVVRFNFIVRETSNDTFGYKVSPFHYWDNLTGDPSWMEYVGAKFLIYNSTSNCIKAVDEPAGNIIDDECNIQNYIDSRLQEWRSIVTSKNIYENTKTCQVKKTLDYSYVYCFPWNITTRGGTQRCPPYVGRLSITEPFILAPNTNFSISYKPKIKRYNVTSRLDMPAVDSIHLGHFPAGSEPIDQGKFFDEIQRLRNLNDELISEQRMSISITKGGTIWWTVLATFVSLLIITIGLVTYNLSISNKNVRKHRRIISDLTELKSVYNEVKIDCPKCTSTSQNISAKHEKSKIEVGSDNSLTINLNNRPLPVPPSLVNDL